jgi:diguanylate cyclase (GGDEF)-like protein
LLGTILKRLTPGEISVTSALAILLISAADHATGYEFSLSIFYLGPIAVGAWYVGRRQGILLAALSVAAWLFADDPTEHEYAHPLIPYWDSVVRFGFFYVVVHLLTLLRCRIRTEEEMARTDGLTGIMNGRAFYELAGTLLALSRRRGSPVALGYVDLDNFKWVNDTMGHAEGDRVLRSVAAEITATIRGTDVAARLGGDEFAVLLPETSSAGARSLFRKVQERLLRAAEAEGWPITVSAGVILFAPAPASVEDAIRAADALMYRVKKTGKNNILFEDMGQAADGPSR